MDLLLAILQSAAGLGLGLGLCLRLARGPAALLLVLAAAAAVAAGLLGPATRSLEVIHTFAAYQELEIVPRHFPVDRVTAPGWQWALAYAAWAALWAALLAGLRSRTEPLHPFLLPLLLAWSGTAVWLGMQKLAAPAAVVQPVGLERFLLPAAFAMACLLAMRAERFLPVLFGLCVGLALLRLPAALFSKVASDGQWGTGLDIHSITAFVNPISRTEVEAASGSFEQQAWLIWAQHLLFLPGLYLLSLGGVAFCVLMFRRHAPDGAQ